MFEIKFTEGAIDGHGGLRRLTEVPLWLNFKPWHHWNGRRRLAIERSPNALAEWEVRIGHFRVFLPKRVLDSVDPSPWQSKNHIDAPIVNGVDQHVRRRRFHARVLLCCCTSGAGICRVSS